MSSVTIRSVRAISIGQGAFVALRKKCRGEVHSLFERTFNILIDGNLVGIARSDISMSPVDVVTDIPPHVSMQTLGIERGMEIFINDDRLRVGDVLEISLSDAKLWRSPTFVERPLPREAILKNLERAKRIAVKKSDWRGLGQLLAHIRKISGGGLPMVRGLNEVAAVALPHIVSLLQAAKSGDDNGISTAAKKLIGLGPGLTPSADDMLMGFISALWWASRSTGENIDCTDRIIRAITSHAGATSLLSQQLLRHASRGEVNEHLHELLRSLLSEADPDIDLLVARLIRIGETSGIDMTLGLLLGLDLAFKNQSRK